MKITPNTLKTITRNNMRLPPLCMYCVMASVCMALCILCLRSFGKRKSGSDFTSYEARIFLDFTNKEDNKKEKKCRK